jgi:hypothetical protein
VTTRPDSERGDLLRGAGTLATAALAAMEERLPWFRSLRPQDRSWVGLVAQVGIAAFLEWYSTSGGEPGEEPQVGPDVFGTAPRELTGSVSLQQALQLLRTVVDTVEAEVAALAPPGGEQRIREAALRYSREVAFEAARIYARAAEARGAWDARLEAGVVEALVRGQVGDLTLSRAGSLGWGRPAWTTALAAPMPAGPVEARLEDLRGHARHSGLFVLTGEAGGGLLVVVGG